MLGEPTTLASLGVAVRMALAQRGIDADAAFREVGLDPDIVKDHEARVPLAQASRLWDRLVVLTGDPTLGLDVAEHNHSTLSHALGQSVLASASIADAIARLQRYDRVVTSGTKLELQRGAAYSDLCLRFPHETIHPAAQGRDCMLGTLAIRCRSLAGEDFRPLRVSFCHPDFGQPGRYRDFFRCEVLFDASQDSMRIDHETLNRPNVYGNPEIASQIDKISEQYLRRLDAPATSYRVQQLMQQGLPSGELSQDEIARRLNRRLSSLRRDLHNEGTSYKALLEQTREELAKAYIAEGQHSLAEVAYLLGFSDQANFTRAFKRWTGATPSEYSH